MFKRDCNKNMNLIIDDCFPKLELEYISHFETTGMHEQNLVVILPQMLDACVAHATWHTFSSLVFSYLH